MGSISREVGQLFLAGLTADETQEYLSLRLEGSPSAAAAARVLSDRLHREFDKTRKPDPTLACVRRVLDIVGTPRE